MTVADLVVQCLENEGVRYVFGVPGEENEDLLFSLEHSSMTFIPTRHEQGAAFMADVWGRLTGKAGVCLATLGPGATNLITGVADAFLDKSPLVAITGQAGVGRIQRESHQYLDVVGMFRPITKWNGSIAHPDVAAECVRKAFKIAGNGAIRKRASLQLRELVNRCHIPVVHTFMAQGAISDNSPQSLHTIGLGLRDIVMDAVDQADLVITVGYDIAEYAPHKWNPKAQKSIIHIDFTPAEVYTHYQPAVELVADITATLRELGGLLHPKDRPFDASWYAPIRQRIIEDLASYELTEGEPFTVPGVLNILRPIMAEDDLLISDVGAHKLWIARNFPVYQPNACLISNGLASMGIALPGGIAAALQNPKRRVVAAMGDGGFLMNSQELETAKRLKVAFTVLVFNDNDYGLISWKQRASHGHETGTRLTNPDFKKYAESFGITGYSPRTLADLKRQLREAVTSRELCVLDVPVDQRVNDALAKQLGALEG